MASPAERMKWAGTILAKMLPTSIFHRQKVALFLRANSNLYQTVNSNHIKFEFFDLIKPMQENLNRLNDFHPSILIGPPAALKMIAKALEENRISISPLKIISGAEVLDPLDRKYMQNVFRHIIHEVYQCTEGFLAATCEYGHLHFNEEFLKIEKKYIAPGKFHPVITDTLRKSQPIINYELNDIITEDLRPCPCGSPNMRIAQIEGRNDDIFKITGHDVFPDFIRRALLKCSEILPNYRIIQTSPDEFTIQTETRRKT